MSDINEEQKRLYKRAEENDYIVKDIAQYEENDSELAKYTILELQDRINKAIEYINRAEINSVGTPLAYTEIGKELLEILEVNNDGKR